MVCECELCHQVADILNDITFDREPKRVCNDCLSELVEVNDNDDNASDIQETDVMSAS